MSLESLVEKYPSVILDILLYFSEYEIENNTAFHRTVMDFCSFFGKKNSLDHIPQPRDVSAICEALVQNQKMSLIRRSGPDGADNQYYVVFSGGKAPDQPTDLLRLDHGLKCLILDFPYIYKSTKNFVLPLEHTGRDGRIQIGTCFIFGNYLVTAKHCLEHAKTISIRGISVQILEQCNFLVSENDLMDLTVATLPVNLGSTISYYDQPSVLDRVITLGYPKIPGYHNFLTVENATVSARYTATTGAVAAIATDFWIKEKLVLITARIRGGNSGGPLIRHDGSLIGVSVNLPVGEGDYDDLGYGVAIPSQFIIEIANGNNSKPINEDFSFIEFNE
jgi:serine protease Do